MNPQKLRQIVAAPAGESDLGGGSGETTGTMAQSMNSTARDTAARIKSAAGETAERAKGEARRFASETKAQTANKIGGYGNAMHESAKSFEQQDPNIAWATHKVADRIQGVADYVRTRDLEELRGDAEDWARRHPLAFFGGLFVGGLVIGSLLKARAPDAPNSALEDWDSENQGGGELTNEPAMDSPASPGL